MIIRCVGDAAGRPKETRRGERGERERRTGLNAEEEKTKGAREGGIGERR